jgi:DNA-binding MarR family transcriptional regulator
VSLRDRLRDRFHMGKGIAFAIIASVQAFSGTTRSRSPETRQLARQLAGFFRYATHVNLGDLLPEITELELSFTQLKALSVLDERDDELSVNLLAESLGLSMAATSRMVDGLFKRGLVERGEDPVDRRVKRVRLTPAGRRTIEKVAAVRIAGMERMLESFTDEQRNKLAAALEVIVEIDEVRRFCPRGRS